MSPLACRKKEKRPQEQSTPTSCRKAISATGNQQADSIVERYLDGGCPERLNLWLSYRDLRPMLSRLEKAMPDSD